MPAPPPEIRRRTPGQVVTRFAPSPTGYLHIGGARTALFNWAFARRHGGVFILRLEDTDVARSTDESTRKIIEDLQWLGLNWDEGPAPPPELSPEPAHPKEGQVGGFGPYFQSQRGDLYRQWLEKLRAAGRVYDDKGAVRFRMPEHDITVHDLVLGDVTIQRAQLEDFIVFKGEASGGGPTFHFANVVDDATMGVTHVLRAQEHLMNTPKHLALFEAFGLEPPKYAHMPLIFNADGSKMSKRDKAKAARQKGQMWIKNNPSVSMAQFADEVCTLWRTVRQISDGLALDPPIVMQFLEKKSDDPTATLAVALKTGTRLPEIDVHDFRQSGYLVDVLLNYLALLGWSPEGKDEAGGERFDKDFVARQFSIERLGKTNARFDRAKLLAFNAERLQKMPPEDFAKALRDHRPLPLGQGDTDWWAPLANDARRWAWFATAYQPRTRTLSEPFAREAGLFFVLLDEQVICDPKAVEKVLKKNSGAGLAALRELRPVLDAITDWQPATIHKAVEDFAANSGGGRPMGEVAQPIRVAVSGGTVSPPIDLTLAILGKQATLNRIDRCLNTVTGN